MNTRPPDVSHTLAVVVGYLRRGPTTRRRFLALCVGLIAGSPLGASSGTLALLLDQFHPDLGMVASRGATREAGKIKGGISFDVPSCLRS